MPLFGSKKKQDDDEAPVGVDIGAAEEDGLLMSTAAAAPEKGGGAPLKSVPVDAAAVDMPNQPVGEEEGDDEPPADEGEEGGSSEEAPANFAVQVESGDATDDLLAVFKDGAAHGETAELTKDLDDIPIQDLLMELREIRSQLPPDVLEQQEAA